jgi:hypothetical protein
MTALPVILLICPSGEDMLFRLSTLLILTPSDPFGRVEAGG